MAIIPAPYFLPPSNEAFWGIYCLGCSESQDRQTYFRRQCTKQGIIDHIMKYRPVILGKAEDRPSHQPPVVPGSILRIVRQCRGISYSLKRIAWSENSGLKHSTCCLTGSVPFAQVCRPSVDARTLPHASSAESLGTTAVDCRLLAVDPELLPSPRSDARPTYITWLAIEGYTTSQLTTPNRQRKLSSFRCKAESRMSLSN